MKRIVQRALAVVITYLSVRPDADRVLPAGYVYPLLLKNQPTSAK